MRLWKTASLAGFVAALTFTLSIPFALSALAQAGKKSGEKKASEEKEKKPEKKARKAAAEEAKDSFDLDVKGMLGAPTKSGDFYEFNYTAVEGKKAVRKKAWIKVDSGTVALADRMVGVEAFKEGDSLRLFGKPLEMGSGGKGLVTGKTYRLQAVRVAIGGKKVKVNEAFADPKDKKFTWCDASVEKTGKAITVNFENASYNVTFDKGAAILQRGDADLKKDVKKGCMVLVQGSTLSEKPDGEKEEHPAFHASQIIVLEKRCQWYEALIP